MKITWIGPYQPVPDRSGADLRSFYLMRELKRRGVSLRGIFLGSHGNRCDRFFEETQLYERGTVRSAFRSLSRRARGEPLTVGRFYHPGIKRRLRDASFVYVDHLHMVPNVPREEAPPFWLDEHNLESDLWDQYAGVSSWPKKIALNLESATMRRFEYDSIRRSRGTGIPSKESAVDLPQDVADKLREVPNGVPGDWLEEGLRRLETPMSPPATFGFIGKYDWFPNRIGMDRFLRTVWEPFHGDNPRRKLLLAGASPKPEWTDIKGVDVKGFVEDKDGFFDSLDAFVLPLNLGSGTRLKALEAVARGLPLLSTRKGVEGLGLGCLAPVESIGELRELMESALEAPGDWESRRQEAYETVEANFRWSDVGETLWKGLRNA